MRLAFGMNCSCGYAIVARTIRPEPVTWNGRCGLAIEETCAAGHVAHFTAESITMEELAAAHIPDTERVEGDEG